MTLGAQTLIVLPVFDRAERVLQDRAMKRGGWASVDQVVPLGRLIDELAVSGLAHATERDWWFGRRAATPAELAILRRRVIAAERREAPAQLAPLLSAAGLSGLLARLFDECAEGRVSPDELSRFARETAPSEARLEVLGALYKRYRDGLNEAGMLDPADKVRIAQAVAGRDDIPLPRLLARCERVEVRDVYDWSALRLALLVALAGRLVRQHGPPDRVTLVIPYSHTGRRLFHYMEQTLREIERRHDLPLDVEFAPIEGRDDHPAARRAAALFEQTQSTAQAGGITLAAAPGKGQERRRVAREIRGLLEQGVAAHEIAVGLRDPESDWRGVTAALREYGVPWHYRRGERLSDTPLMRHVADLLSAVLEGFPVAAMERILTSAFTATHIPVDDPTTRPATGNVSSREERRRATLSDARLASVLRAAGVRDTLTGATDDKTGYQVRLEAYLSRFRVPESEATRATQGDLWQDPRELRERRAYAQVDAQVRGILERVDRLSTLSRRRSLKAWARSLHGLFERRDFDPRRAFHQRAILFPAREHPDPVDGATARGVSASQQAWEALGKVLREIETAHGADRIELGASGFLALLLEVGREVSLNPRGGRGAAVRVVPVRQLAGGSFRHVFLPHVNEGAFPASPRIDPLFRDAERFAFNRWRREQAAPSAEIPYQAFRVEEPQPEDDRIPVRRSEEAVLFALALSSASQTAHISWSTRDRSGRPSLPSLFIDALRAEGEHETTESLEVIPPLENVVTDGELVNLALRASRMSPAGPRSEAWRDVASRALPSDRLGSVSRRARVELARDWFFEQARGGDRFRVSAPLEIPELLLPYLGYLSHAQLPEWLAHDRFRFGADSPASPSRLDRYGQCPSKFFFQDVLRLRPDDEVEEEMDIRVKGGLLHQVLERFYTNLEAAGFDDLTALAGPRRDEVVAILDATLEQAVEELRPESHYGHPDLMSIQLRAIRDDVLATFDKALDRGNDKLHLPLDPPLYNEWVFGEADTPAVAIDLGQPLGTIHLKGRVDRVDQLEPGKVLITDYKSGNAWTYRKKLDPSSLHRTDFQLSIYAVAALQGIPDTSRVDVQYVGLKDGRSAMLDWPRLEYLLPRAVLTPSSEHAIPLTHGLSEVLRGIHGARFAPATRNCRFCEFDALCRVNARVKQRGWDSEEPNQ